MSFKITLNKPAFDMFLHGETAIGLRIEIRGERVFFKAVPQRDGKFIIDDPDVAPMTNRERGGAEAFIEGRRAPEIRKLLTNKLGLPSFVLHREKDGWFSTTEWDGGPKNDLTPSRWVPHLRVWDRDGSKSAPVSETGKVLKIPEPSQIHKLMHKLKSMVDDAVAAPTLRQSYVLIDEAKAVLEELHPKVLAVGQAEVQAALVPRADSRRLPEAEQPATNGASVRTHKSVPTPKEAVAVRATQTAQQSKIEALTATKPRQVPRSAPPMQAPAVAKKAQPRTEAPIQRTRRHQRIFA